MGKKHVKTISEIEDIFGMAQNHPRPPTRCVWFRVVVGVVGGGGGGCNRVPKVI